MAGCLQFLKSPRQKFEVRLRKVYVWNSEELETNIIEKFYHNLPAVTLTVRVRRDLNPVCITFTKGVIKLGLPLEF